MSSAGLRSLFAAWLITGAPALACQHEAVGDGPETVTVALTPALAERTSRERATTVKALDAPAALPPVARSARLADEAVLPSEIAGIWEVAEVLVIGQDAPRRTYRRNDARLVGRSLSVREGRVRFSFGTDLDCRQVRWPRRELTWGELDEQAFRRAPSGGRRLADFGLTVKRKQPVTVYVLCPPGRSPAPLHEGEWVVEYKPGELLFREDPQYLLRLTRRPEDAPPAPASFTCASARTPTQRAICQSHELASWDRSVSRALDDLVKARPEREDEMKLSQAAYVQRRDSCGAEPDCIEQEEMARVGELIQLRAQ
jgi:hypothetical protein